jgi:hypothetical protein
LDRRRKIQTERDPARPGILRLENAKSSIPGPLAERSE